MALFFRYVFGLGAQYGTGIAASFGVRRRSGKIGALRYAALPFILLCMSMTNRAVQQREVIEFGDKSASFASASIKHPFSHKLR